MVFLYLSTVIPSIWFLELSLLQSTVPVNSTPGLENDFLAPLQITVVGVPPQTYLPRSNIKALPYIR